MRGAPSQPEAPRRSPARHLGLPPDLIHGFWGEVEAELEARHGLAGEEALRGIVRYLAEVAPVGRMLYHQTPRDAAAAVVAGGYARTVRKVS